MNIKTELDQYRAARSSLWALRESLMLQVAEIDKALEVAPVRADTKLAKGTRTVGTPKGKGTKEAVLQAVSTPSTLKEIKAALPNIPEKSLESVVYALASSGQLSKDGSKPSKFSKSNGGL